MLFLHFILFYGNHASYLFDPFVPIISNVCNQSLKIRCTYLTKRFYQYFTLSIQTFQFQWSSVTSNARFVLYRSPTRAWMIYTRICCFRRPHFVTEGICVWELRLKTKDWIVVQNMPDSLFKELLNSSTLLSFNCVSHGDMIYLSNRKSPQLIVIFNYAQNLWQRVDSCITHNLHPMYSWFSYYPRLDASI